MAERCIRTAAALPPYVEAVQGDLTGPASALEEWAEHLEQVAVWAKDREVATRCRGTASALRQHAENLRDEAEGFGRRMLPEAAEWVSVDLGVLPLMKAEA